jgi:hypothetical protein
MGSDLGDSKNDEPKTLRFNEAVAFKDAGSDESTSGATAGMSDRPPDVLPQAASSKQVVDRRVKVWGNLVIEFSLV